MPVSKRVKNRLSISPLDLGAKPNLNPAKDPVGSVWVNLVGNAATLAGGVYLGPGDSLELSNVVPVHTINAIGDIASNPNVIVVEG